jgi:opacity protein-like surface antigen
MKTFALFAVLAVCASAAQAQQSSDRAGSWEYGVQVISMPSENFTGQQGTSLDIGDDTGWGVTGGYNFTNRLAVMLDMSFLTPNYSATRVIENPLQADSVSAELEVFTIQLKGVLNLLEGPFTPFVEAGAGWTTVDSNIIAGPPTTGCWFDPWWGYVCDTFFETYHDTRTSYSMAAGLRYDMPNGLSLKASYGLQEIDSSQVTEDVSLENWRLEAVWLFN